MILLNFLSPDSIKKEERTEFLMIGYAVIGLTAAFCTLSYGMRFRALKGLEDRLNAAQLELNRYESIVKQVEALEATKQVLETKMNVINSLMNGGLVYPKFLDDLISVLPQGISFKNLTTQLGGDGKMVITLTADSVDNYAIADFIAALSTDPDFSDVELGPISTQSTGKASFSSFNLTAKYLKKQS